MINWSDSDIIPVMESVLDQDKIILTSGDTVLGLLARLTQNSYQEMNRIKQRSGKPYLIVMSSAEKLDLFTDQSLSDRVQMLISTCWPGPVTLVFKARSDLPSWMVSSDGTIALRVPDHEFLRKLLVDYDGLFSTSANISNDPIPHSMSQIDPRLTREVALSCFDRGQTDYPSTPSTIIDCATGDIKVIRFGAFSQDMLDDLIG